MRGGLVNLWRAVGAVVGEERRFLWLGRGAERTWALWWTGVQSPGRWGGDGEGIRVPERAPKIGREREVGRRGVARGVDRSRVGEIDQEVMGSVREGVVVGAVLDGDEKAVRVARIPRISPWTLGVRTIS